MEPNLDPKARFGLYNPNTGVVDPFQLTLAMAENAVTNGVKFCRNTEVISIQAQNGKISSVETTAGRFEPKVVINAAGLYSDRIAAMAEEIDFSVRPRRGQYFLYDREWQGHVKHCIYSSPTKTSKGMIILPTIEGNILAGDDGKIPPAAGPQAGCRSRRGPGGRGGKPDQGVRDAVDRKSVV